MDYAKLDAPLVQAIDDDGDPGTRVLPVVIRLTGPAAGPEHDILRSHGVEPPEGNRTVATAILSADDIAALSDRPWVLALTLSGRRHPLAPLDD
ncbi:hypothetical protein OG948_02005 [Embleya sp. NBC_00888]|uniref:hypothetical protein n=1 Tax=Embleya sp. NBC_00888 TaxID=2975960 RepID=UPI00386AD05B|nr:hypothetical protein OG948_02005 [Embleya sp. NBC_00888]